MATSSIPSVSQSSAVHETAWRRRLNPLRAHLSELKAQINRLRPHDPISDLITEWQAGFYTSVHKCDTEQEATVVTAIYLREIRAILVEPLFRSPLDGEALLGTDGETYTRMALDLFWDRNPHCAGKSPLHPERARFDVYPHTLVRYLINTWLPKYNILIGQDDPKSAEIQAEYQRLQARNASPPQPAQPAAPVVDEARRARAAALRQQLRAQDEWLEREFTATSARLNEPGQEILQRAFECFVPVAEGMSETQELNQRQIEELRIQDREAQDACAEAIRRAHVDLMQAEEELRVAEAELNDVNVQLRENQDLNNQLGQDVRKLHTKLDKRNKQWATMIAKIAASALVAWGATYILQEIATSMASDALISGVLKGVRHGIEVGGTMRVPVNTPQF